MSQKRKEKDNFQYIYKFYRKDLLESHFIIWQLCNLYRCLPEAVCDRGILLNINRKVQKVLIFTTYLHRKDLYSVSGH